MGTFMSYFQCKCEGFFNKQINDSETFACNKCFIEKDFSTKLNQLATTEEIINNSTNLAQIEEICSQLEKDESIHDLYYLNIKAFMKYSELSTVSRDLETLEKVEARTKAALNLIRELDPGSSKVTGRLLMALAESQEKIILVKKQEAALGPREVKQAVANIVKTKYIANKMLSQNCVTK